MPSTEAGAGRHRRLGLGLGAGLVVVLVVSAPAWASSSGPPRVDRQAWGRVGPAGPVAPRAGNLYVSAAGAEQARSYFHVDVAGADEAQLATSTIVLGEASDSVLADQAVLAACALSGPFGGTGEVTGSQPVVDCTVRTRLERAAGGTWSVPLGVFAHVLAAGGPGLAVVADASSATAVFSVSLAAARTTVEVAPAVASSEGPGSATGSGPPPGASPEPATAPSSTASGSPGALSPIASALLPAPLAGPTPSTRPAAAATEAQPPSGPARSPSPSPVGARSLPSLRVRSVARPPTLVILAPVLLAAAGLWARGRWLRPTLLPEAGVPARALTVTGAWVLGIAVALLASETTAYKLGLVAIFFVGAIGLHILVNWSGELSLAHAAFIGLPAFAVAQLSAHSGASAILFLPAAVVVGALLGLVVAIPALRARGLQVALVTLAVGIAVDRFFFVRSWVIGPSGGVRIPVPSLFGVQFETSRSLIPVLVVIVLVAVLACRAILASKVGRALSFVRANPDAAAAAGIPVAFYRSVVYTVAGGFAGLAGASYVLWVQRVSPRAFPLELGFTYLVIAALAGKGGLVGVALSAALVEGGQVFSILPHNVALYLGPIVLIFNVTRYQEGFNGALREIRQRLGERRGVMTVPDATPETAPEGDAAPTPRFGTAIRLPVVVASCLVVAGFAALALAWYHAGNTDQLWIQNQEIVSGGLGGLALVVVGSMLLVRDALINGRALAPGGGVARAEALDVRAVEDRPAHDGRKPGRPAKARAKAAKVAERP